MIETLDWIVADWFHTLISIAILIIISQFKLITIEINNGSTYIEKVDENE